MSPETSGGASRSTDPILGSSSSDKKAYDGQRVDVRKSHPNLYWMIMTYAVGNIALGINFLVFTPTFLVYHLPNWVWSAIFLTLGISKIILLNVHRHLKLTRLFMAAAIAFFLFFSVGTAEPFMEGKGSLQLPILYVLLAMLQIPVLIEPFINPWTKKGE